MTKAVLQHPNSLYNVANYAIDDNFDQLPVSGGRYTTGGTIAAVNRVGGAISLTTAASDNAIAFVEQTVLAFQPQLDKAINFMARALFNESADAAFFIGITPTRSGAVFTTAGLLSATFEGIGFAKENGVTNLSVVAGDGTAVNKVELVANVNRVRPDAIVGVSSSYRQFGFDVNYTAAAVADVNFTLDGKGCYGMKGTTLTSFNLSSLVCAVKAEAAAAKVANLASWNAAQLR